ncbi:hypothetical protein [Dactylosporangium sp. CA-092794]|uniref:hypothetical protein n=1 Tax=Dactylosporangium sp. CA-092794 TaxID=3239929 RepID=UPI003D91F301
MTAFEDLLDALDDAGLWSHLPEDHKRAAQRALASGDGVTWPAGGAWRADGEDLAEGDVEAWLGSMAGPLHDCGVDLRVATVIGPWDAGSAGYSVCVNGTTLDLYTFVEGEPARPATEDPWMDCSVRPAAEVNRLLEAAGSSRRVALFWPGGNDGFAVLGEGRVLRRISAAAASWCNALIP